MSQTKAVNASETKEDGIEEGCEKIMICMSDARESLLHERPITMALDQRQGVTYDRGEFYLMILLAPKVGAPIPQLLFDSEIALKI